MDPDLTAARDLESTISAGIFTDAQRGVFRSAGLWMMILGAIEVIAGGLMGSVFLLGLLGSGAPAAEQVFSSASGGAAMGALQVVATLGIGIITILAGRAFQKASREPRQCLEAATTAVAELQDLYERQVWIFSIFVMIVVGTAMFGR